jgi:hypothetical protein
MNLITRNQLEEGKEEVITGSFLCCRKFISSILLQSAFNIDYKAKLDRP